MPAPQTVAAANAVVLLTEETSAYPTAKIFFPALMSRSIPVVPQLGQSQMRIFKYYPT